MADREFWKRIYRNKFPHGQRRARAIAELIRSWGFSFEEFGFLADSVEYDPSSPDEKGKPDWKIWIAPNRKFILLETTGTEYSRAPHDLWIRNDKFEFAERHPDFECWAGHIVESKKLIRFIKLENKEKYPLQYRAIEGNQEKFRIIPENISEVLSEEQFRIYINSLREKDQT